jgi:site-specific DNA recombinase
MTSQDPALLRRLLRAKDRMDAASEEDWPVERLANVSGVSDAHFARSFKEAFGVPPHRYLLTRRAKHLLTGLARCGECDAPLVAAGKDYLCCSAARRKGTCKNHKGIRRGVLAQLILDALKHNLMQPEPVAEFIREFHAEVNRQRRVAELTASLKRRELDEVQRKLDGLIEAIADGFRAPRLQAKLDELEQRKASLAAAIESAPTSAPRLHPNLSELYRRKVETLQEALADPATQTEALEIFRGLIERVSVRHTEKGAEVELIGEIANMVTLSAGAESVGKEPYRSSVKVVAGVRNHLYRTRVEIKRARQGLER